MDLHTHTHIQHKYSRYFRACIHADMQLHAGVSDGAIHKWHADDDVLPSHLGITIAAVLQSWMLVIRTMFSAIMSPSSSFAHRRISFVPLAKTYMQADLAELWLEALSIRTFLTCTWASAKHIYSLNLISQCPWVVCPWMPIRKPIIHASLTYRQAGWQVILTTRFIFFLIVFWTFLPAYYGWSGVPGKANVGVCTSCMS